MAVEERVRRNRFERVSRKGWTRLECGRECGCGGNELSEWESLAAPVQVCPVESVKVGRSRNEEGKPEAKVMSLRFQVADVKKPLVSVKRITEQGNHVAFGPKDEDNYIVSSCSGNKMFLKPNGKGSYLMEVNFVGGGSTQITVDSGAEESVCPWEWGSQFGLKPADRWLAFRNASGGLIEHYGTREVLVESPF